MGRQRDRRNLLPHEYTHSWDGKYRRGADLWTPDYRTPMRDSCSGSMKARPVLGLCAPGALGPGHQAGHARRLSPRSPRRSTIARRANGARWSTPPTIRSSRRAAQGLVSWQRSEDYYNEGLLIWMEVDSILREQSGGTKSIDDFAAPSSASRRRLGRGDLHVRRRRRDAERHPPYDWKGFLKTSASTEPERAPKAGFDRATATSWSIPTSRRPTFKATRRPARLDLSYSLGLVLGASGASPGDLGQPGVQRGADLGDEIVAVNGEAIPATAEGRDQGGQGRQGADQAAGQERRHYREVAIDYHGGLRYPHLEKTARERPASTGCSPR
jgi:predicted metalloprotease with PDZ domain